MIDFIYSSRHSDLKNASDSLAIIRSVKKQDIKEWSGDWGCLAVAGECYPGYDIIESEDCILVVVGGPIPRKYTNSPVPFSADNLTVQLLEILNSETEADFLNDIFGHFLILKIDKTIPSAKLVTDPNSFVPSYHLQIHADANSDFLIGTHADALAQSVFSGPELEEEVDLVSVADFLKFKTVTFPNTLYKGIRQLHPGAFYQFDPKNPNAAPDDICRKYWEPFEDPGKISDINSAATQLRDLLVENTRMISACSNKLNLMMSAGEDSRSVLAAIPEETATDCFTFLDTYNREARIAEMATNAYGKNWKPIYRKPTHYIENIESSICLAESANFFIHSHINGFDEKEIGDGPLIGGNKADDLFRGYNAKGFGKLGIVFKVDKNAWEHPKGQAKINATADLQEQVYQRRKEFNEFLAHYRPSSWAEWHSIWPASMDTASTFLFINRRMKAAREPYIDGKMTALGAVTPLEFKLSRRLFSKAMQPLFRKTKFLPHGEGHFPYFGLLVNTPVNLFHSVKNKISRLFPGKKVNDGPWQAFEDIVSEPLYEQKEAYYMGQCPSRIKEMIDNCTKSTCPVDNLARFQIIVWAALHIGKEPQYKAE